MTPHEYRLYLLSPLMVSAGVAAMSASADIADMIRYMNLRDAADQAVRRPDPPPPVPPAPPLRWVCRPPDFDPMWTVGVLWRSRRGYKIGKWRYNSVTGRSTRGRATWHGRLWDPRAQQADADRWQAQVRALESERSRLIGEAWQAHRTAVAARLKGAILCEERSNPPRRVRMIRQSGSTGLIIWFCVEDWIASVSRPMDEATFRAHYRPVVDP